MDKQIEISRIVIRVGDTELSLSVEQARELRRVLDDVLGSKEVTLGFYPNYPAPIPIYPVYPTDPYWTVYRSTDRFVTITANTSQ